MELPINFAEKTFAVCRKFTKTMKLLSYITFIIYSMYYFTEQVDFKISSKLIQASTVNLNHKK